MIDYLEQLERDLIDAVDRRAAHRRPDRRRRWRLPGWTPGLAMAAALVVIVVVVVVALAARRTDTERAVAPVAPSSPVTLTLAGDLMRLDATTWSVRGRGPGGVGTLVFNGDADLIAPHGRKLSSFTWTTAGGSLAGCITPAIHRLNDGRVAWDSLAPISDANGTLRRYRGRYVRITGQTHPSTSQQSRKPIESPRTPASAGPPRLITPGRC